MSKDLWLRTHERLVSEYMDANPSVSWDEAYERTVDQVDEAVADTIAAMADYAKDRAKEGK